MPSVRFGAQFFNVDAIFQDPRATQDCCCEGALEDVDTPMQDKQFRRKLQGDGQPEIATASSFESEASSVAWGLLNL